MPFEPGKSGNPSGLRREQKFRAALDRAVAQDDGKRLRDAAERLLDFAAQGEQWAVKELADRLDGKAAQSTTLNGDLNLNGLADVLGSLGSAANNP